MISLNSLYWKIIYENKLHYVSLVCDIGMKGSSMKICYMIFLHYIV